MTIASGRSGQTSGPAGPTSTRRPPGPKGRWLIGNTYDYDRDRLGFVSRCQREYGDVFRFGPTTIVVQHPTLIHELFTRTNTDFRTESPLLSGDTAAERELIRTLPRWMASRRKGWHGMNRAVATAHGARFLDQLDRLVHGVAGRPVDVLRLMKTFSGRAVADFCLGGTGDASDVADAIDVSVHENISVMASSLALPRWLPLPKVRRVPRASARADTLIARRVANRHAANAERPAQEPTDLLDVLLEGPGTRLEPAGIAELLNVTMRASHGVPAATLAWAVRQFALEPALLDPVRAEAERVRAARQGEPVAPTELPYTEALVKELLRAYPPTWLMGRHVITETTLGNWELRPGDEVMFSAYHVHRDPRWWEHPEEFRPERWLRSDKPYEGRAYFPFGAGPRICLGNQLGMMQLILAVAWLADAYDIEVTNVEDAVPAPRALFVPQGLEARFRSRHPAA